jgi:trans-aconitate 2-methyltransferase
MNKSNDWNPDLYRQFEKQRTQPVIDLISRLQTGTVERILDVGCGPGNSTEELLKRWSNAEIIGLDSSPSMIKQAEERLPSIKFELQDANTDSSNLGKFDVIFSNAAIQWMPNHKQLLKKLFDSLNPSGVIGIQLPDVSKMGVQLAVDQTSQNIKWRHKFTNTPFLNCRSVDEYYQICSELSTEVYLWSTDYYHVLESLQSIVDWYKSTGMKPYLDALENDSERQEFESEVLNRLKEYYQIQSNGHVLFPFTRIFITLYKTNS